MTDLGFGDYLRRAREERKLTLAELGRRVGVSAQHLSDVEHGRRSALPLLGKLALPLGKDPDTLRSYAHHLDPGLAAWLAHQVPLVKALRDASQRLLPGELRKLAVVVEQATERLEYRPPTKGRAR